MGSFIMGLIMSKAKFNETLNQLAKKYVIYAPKKYKGEGTFSDTDRVRYGTITQVEENQVSHTKRFYCRLLKHCFSLQKLK